MTDHSPALPERTPADPTLGKGFLCPQCEVALGELVKANDAADKAEAENVELRAALSRAEADRDEATRDCNVARGEWEAMRQEADRLVAVLDNIATHPISDDGSSAVRLQQIAEAALSRAEADGDKPSPELEARCLAIATLVDSQKGARP